MAWATAMGLGGGLVMVLFFSVWPRVFGRRASRTDPGRGAGDDGARVGGGPLLLAWCVEWTGSYAAMFRMLAGVIALVGAMALFTRDRIGEST